MGRKPIIETIDERKARYLIKYREYSKKYYDRDIVAGRLKQRIRTFKRKNNLSQEEIEKYGVNVIQVKRLQEQLTSLFNSSPEIAKELIDDLVF